MRRSLILAAALSAFPCSTGCSSSCLPDTPVYSVSAGEGQVQAADANGDGIMDLFLLGCCGDVSVLVSRGDGTFFPEARIETGTGYGLGPSLGDVNGDGLLDVVAVRDEGFVDVVLNKGDATFEAPVRYTVLEFPDSATVADVNGDGANDLVIASDLGGSIGVMLNQGGAVLGAVATFPAPFEDVHGVSAGDFDGDGYVDLAIRHSGQICWLWNQGNGMFAQGSCAYGQAGYLGRPPTAIDADGDGDLDLISVNPLEGILGVFLNQGGREIAHAVEQESEQALLGATIVDMNGDSLPDVVATDLTESDALIQVWSNRGGGLFSPETVTKLPAQKAPNDLAAADFDGDGALEIAALQAYKLMILTSQCADGSE